MNISEEIFSHVEQEFPKEACGLLVEIGNELVWKPCENTSDNPEEEFELDKKVFLQTLIDGHDIVAIVHSHPNNCTPSHHDIKACNFIKIPYMIVNYENKEINVINPGDLNV